MIILSLQASVGDRASPPQMDRWVLESCWMHFDVQVERCYSECPMAVCPMAVVGSKNSLWSRITTYNEECNTCRLPR